jgi:leucyl/phenylalanyl-tRNA--protein transferase
VIAWLAPDSPFPPVGKALKQPNGLLAAGGELTADRIVDAYSHGIFPWYSEGVPVLWWSPDPRMVLRPQNLKVSRSLGKTVKSGKFEVRFDTCFERVMRECAAPRNGHDGTWIVNDIVEAYTALHERGFAHCVETWCDGELVGGLYGVALPKVFFGESMFARETDASKVALVALVEKLTAEGYGLIDCQQETRHLASLGAAPIPRAEFVQNLRELIHFPPSPTHW